MTKKEAAIVSAYTGYLIGKFSDMHEYAENLFGHPIFTHQFPALASQLREKAKLDFVSIRVEDYGPNCD